MTMHAVQSANAAGCASVIVACTPETFQLHDYVGPAATCAELSGCNWLETAVAALPKATRTVLVVSGAMPLLSAATMTRLMQCQQETADSLVLLTTSPAHPSPSGGIFRDTAGRVARILKEQDTIPAQPPAEYFSTGAACFSSEWLWENRSNVQALSENSLECLVAHALAVGAPVGTMRHTETELELLQVVDRTDLARAESALRDSIRVRAMQSGVTLVDPATVWIDDTVTFGRDITILPNCHLYGNSAVGDDCTIGPNSRLQDTRLAAGVAAVESVLEGAQVGESVRIGPYAHLRPGTVVAHDVEIGNYAELKNTQVDSGAKIHHVGYLGDTVVGSDVNVGAGTITCNYDGVEKHETEIGDGAFVGSGTLLVAPVVVGRKAMTGAGSVVTRDVPPSAKAYGVPARVQGVRAQPTESDRTRPDEKRRA